MAKNAWGDEIVEEKRNAFGDLISGQVSTPPNVNAYRIGNTNEPPGYVEQFAGGAKHALDRAALGLKGVFTDLSDEDKALLEQGKGFVQGTGPASTVGQIAGDVGMSLGPVGLANRAAMLPRAAAALGRFAPAAAVGADVAANAGYSALTSPEDRGAAALYGGAGAAGGRALAHTFGGAVRPTAEAQRLLDQGVRLTPGQAGGKTGMGALADVYERGLEAIPGVGRIVGGARQRGLEDWNRVMLQEARPGVVAESMTVSPTTKIGREGITQAKGELSDQYKRVFPEGVNLQFDKQTSEVYDAVVGRLSNKVAPSGRAKFDEISQWIGMQAREGIDAAQWKEVVERELDAAKKTALRDGQRSLYNALNDLDGQLQGALPHFQGIPPHAAGTAADLDRRYFNLKTLEDASNKAGPIRRGGVLYPSDLAITAAKKVNQPMLEKALAAQAQFGATPTAFDKVGNMARAAAVGALGHTVAGGAAVPAVVVSLLGTTEIGRRFLLGQIPWQEYARAHPDVAAKVGRALGQQGGQQQ